MGTGTNKTTDNTQTTSQVPQHIVDSGKQLFNTAANYLVGTGGALPTFDPKRDLASGLAETSGFTGDQQKAFDITRNNAGSHQPAMQAAFSLAGQAATPTGYGPNGEFLGNLDQSAIHNAMSPYTSEVTNRGLFDMHRQYQQDANNNDAAAINGGAAWGSRARNQNDQLAERFYKSAGDFSAQQHAAAYDKGASLAQQNWQNYSGNADANRSAAASSARLFPELANQGRGFDQADAQALYGQGAAQQQLTQTAIDRARKNQLDAQQAPIDALNFLSSFNTMQPYSKVTNTNTTQSQSSTPGLGQIAGTAIGALSAFPFSDENMKDVVGEAKTPEQALAAFAEMPVDRWKYKPEVQDAYGLPDTEVDGAMAQDYHKHLDAAAVGPHGELVVDTAKVLGNIHLALKALADRTSPKKRKAA